MPSRPDVTVAEFGEKRLISEIVRPLVEKTGSGKSTLDDCATISIEKGSLFVTTDKIPEDLVAWRKGLMTLKQLGRYLVEVNASDICSMGIEPTQLLVNIAIPRDYLVRDFEQIYEGLSDRCIELGICIVGGDTKFASNLSMVGVALGQGSSPGLNRWGANLGDLLFVSGAVGGFGAALRLLIEDKWNSPGLSSYETEQLKNLISEPQCEIGLVEKLRSSGIVSSCMDISDGFGQSLIELSQASSVGLKVDLEKVPTDPYVKSAADVLGCSMSDIILGPGLDLKLLGTVSNSSRSLELCDRLGLSVIGEVTKGHIELRMDDMPMLHQRIQGYDQLSDDLFSSLKT